MNQQTHEYIEKLESALRAMGILEFSGEMQLLEWMKSTSRDGPKIKFMLPDDESVIPFEVATVKKGKTAGQLYHIFAIRIDDNDTRTNSYVPEPKLKEKTSNYLAKSMHKDGYFRNPKLWDAMEEKGIYTQEMHKVYVESLPCCGIKFAPHIKPCDGDVVMHHVKTSANSGVRIKPLHWYGVPLCHKHHMTWAHGSHKGSASHEDRHDVMLPHAVGLTAERIKAAFKNSLGLESLSEITQEMLDDFEKYLFGQVVNNYSA